ncbi:hypothetical protein [Salinispora fenicalii]|uniref:hypothetical protein n=1 Tax=Salinispora fenicalii TaxID=1137263 RepID=UPI000482CC04|nr:hypothetical protein [Salinispora fenicalii]
MRLTVGPLPPAVYWRRRAVVLGAVFLFLVVVFYSSWGSSEEPANKNASGQEQSSGDSETPAGTEQPEPPDDSGDAGGEEPPNSESSESSEPDDPAPAPPAPPVTDAGTCADSEISVTAIVQSESMGQGSTVDLQLKIQNSSDRTCSRDVGADLQELFVKDGAAMVWSSDTCGTNEGSDVHSLTPGGVRSFWITWNGNDHTRCQGGVATGPEAPPGTYEVFARVGTKYSKPVQLEVTG